jgi:cyclopropane-fatty-acyl-phospholipid synthase
MPKRKACWASWNFLGSEASANSTEAVCVTYWVQNLQSLPADAPDLFVTLNPLHKPREDSIIRRLSLAHPQFSFAAWRAQERIPDMQSSKGCVYYAGAWCGYGFHEDGMRAAVAVTERLGLSLPWVPRATYAKTSLFEGYTQRVLSRYLAAAVHTGRLNIVFPSGHEQACGEAAPAREALQVVPSFLSAQPPSSGTGATAVHADLTRAQPARAAEDWMAPGPSDCAVAASVRVLHSAAFTAAVRGGLRGVVRAYVARDFEVSDLGALCRVLAANAEGLVAAAGRLGPLRWLAAKQHLAEHHAAASGVQDDCVRVETLVDAIGVIPCLTLLLRPSQI